MEMSITMCRLTTNLISSVIEVGLDGFNQLIQLRFIFAAIKITIHLNTAQTTNQKYSNGCH